MPSIFCSFCYKDLTLALFLYLSLSLYLICLTTFNNEPNNNDKVIYAKEVQKYSCCIYHLIFVGHTFDRADL